MQSTPGWGQFSLKVGGGGVGSDMYFLSPKRAERGGSELSGHVP